MLLDSFSMLPAVFMLFGMVGFRIDPVGDGGNLADCDDS